MEALLTRASSIVQCSALEVVGSAQAAAPFKQVAEDGHAGRLRGCMPGRVALVVGMRELAAEVDESLQGLRLAVCTAMIMSPGVTTSCRIES